jgi:hypothetical protein
MIGNVLVELFFKVHRVFETEGAVEPCGAAHGYI